VETLIIREFKAKSIKEEVNITKSFQINLGEELIKRVKMFPPRKS